MKLLIYSPLSLSFGGGFEHWILEIAPRLNKFGVSTTIISTNSTVGDIARIHPETIRHLLDKNSIKYFEIPYIPIFSRLSNSPIPRIRKLRKIVSMIDFDILYFVNAYAFQDLIINLLKFIKKKPVVSAQHSVLFNNSTLHNLYINTLGKKLLKNFDAYHTLNAQDVQTFKKWGLTGIHLIPIGVNTQKFKPRRFKTYNGKFKVLFVGRLTSQKGIDILYKAIEIINKDFFQNNLEFVIVGSGPMQTLVQTLVKKYRNVRYLGSVTDKDLYKIYSDCDLFIMPSRMETFGIVALEAQASGLPVIATNISGPRDIIINDFTGTLIPEENPISLALTIKSYYLLRLHDYEKYKRICFNARYNAIKKFNWDIITEDIYNMLSYILRMHNGKTDFIKNIDRSRKSMEIVGLNNDK